MRSAVLARDLVEQALELGDIAIDGLLEIAVASVLAGDFIEGLLASGRIKPLGESLALAALVAIPHFGREAPRGGRPAQGGPSQGPANPLESLSLDIGRLMDRNLAAEMWDRYQRGESKAFTKRLYTPAGQKAFDEVGRKYRADRNFKQTVDRYITEFERLLDEVARDERGPAVLRSHLTSETGMVYTLLAHAAGRLG